MPQRTLLEILDLEKAAVKSENGDFEKAIEYQKKALDVIMAHDDERLKAEAAGNYAYYLFESRIGDNVPAAFDYYKKSIELYEAVPFRSFDHVMVCGCSLSTVAVLRRSLLNLYYIVWEEFDNNY